MKRLSPCWLLALSLTLVLAPLAFAVAAAPAAPVAPFATAVTTVTGIAISPLLGTGAQGADQWMAAKDEQARAKLPW